MAGIELPDEEVLLSRAAGIPCDRELLEPIGLVIWAAILLQHSVRDLIGAIEGELTNEPFVPPLGPAIDRLRKAASGLPESEAAKIIEWCEHVGKPAKEARDGVVHAIAATIDGQQAITGSKPGRPDRYTNTVLRRIAGQLDLAALKLGQASEGVERYWQKAHRPASVAELKDSTGGLK